MLSLAATYMDYVTVHFAVPGGGEHKQRVDVCAHRHALHQQQTIVSAALTGCKRKKRAVANVLRITHGKAVLFDYQADTARRFR